MLRIEGDLAAIGRGDPISVSYVLNPDMPLPATSTRSTIPSGDTQRSTTSAHDLGRTKPKYPAKDAKRQKWPQVRRLRCGYAGIYRGSRGMTPQAALIELLERVVARNGAAVLSWPRT
jgi:hypothetical protein